MRRRYPRLSATDYCGRSVAIPLTIAPVLYPHERFTSLSQQKVLEIAEANKRLQQEETTSKAKNKPDILPVKKRESVISANGSSVTDTPRSKGSSNTEISTPESGSPKRRVWSSADDDIVLCAVLMKEPGKCLVGRLPQESSAVMQRLCQIKERRERGLREDGGNDGQMDSCEGGEGAKVEDEAMDEIPPL